MGPGLIQMGKSPSTEALTGWLKALEKQPFDSFPFKAKETGESHGY